MKVISDLQPLLCAPIVAILLPLAALPLFGLAAHPEGPFVAKWWVIYGMGVAMLLQAFGPNRWSWPRLNFTNIGYAALLMMTSICVFRDWRSLIDLHRILFGLVVLWSFNQADSFERCLPLILIGSLLPIVYTTWSEWVTSDWTLLSSLNPEHLGGGFGNVNMLGEALLFIYPTLLFNPFRSRALRIVCAMGALLVVGLTIVTRCRSAILGSMIVTMIYFFRARSRRFTLTVMLALVTLVLGAELLLSSVSKRDTINLRWRMWQQTTKLIADHPWGIGRHKFAFRFSAYQGHAFGEDNILPNPHNEFLLTIAEDGLPYMVLLVIFYGSLVCRRHRPPRPSEIALASALGVQMFFQFPLEDPFPFVLTGLTMGRWLKRTESDLGQTAYVPGIIPAAAGGLLLVLGLRTILPEWAVAQATPDLRALRTACEINPVDPRACWAQGAEAAREERYDECIQVMSRELERFPDFVVYRKVRGFCFWKEKHLSEACRDFKDYLALVWSPPIKKIYEENCSAPSGAGTEPHSP